ncbi:MAG: PHB depolymerase family esterase [Bacteroidota bacterium]
MLRLLPLFLALLVISAGCSNDEAPLTNGPADDVQVGEVRASLEHGGQAREYILYAPASYTGEEAMPLVLNFHGYTSNAQDQMGYGDFRPIADTAGFIVVHPQGTLLEGNTHWNVGGWTLASTTDDVAFTSALIDAIADDYAIDRDRVYSTGMSNGGYMSFLLACQLSDQIAAVASVTGSMTPQTMAGCTPQHPMPVMQIHGTQDSVVPYAGSAAWTLAVTDVVDYWATYNEAAPSAVTTRMPDVQTDDGSTVTRYVHAAAGTYASVEHLEVIGGDHTWPGNAVGGRGTNQDVNASALIWDFFAGYDLRGAIR